jgi:hypothetical protein
VTIGIKHAQKLWLTVCTLDQRLSATIGVSPDTGSAEQPFVSSYFNDASNIEIRLNLAIANILTRVVKGTSTYSSTLSLSRLNLRVVLSQHQIEDALTSSFVDNISTELTYLQSLVEHMKNIQPLCSTPSLLTTSRQVATLHLHFYHVRCPVRGCGPTEFDFSDWLFSVRYGCYETCSSAPAERWSARTGIHYRGECVV